jgi:hypothetical protein
MTLIKIPDMLQSTAPRVHRQEIISPVKDTLAADTGVMSFWPRIPLPIVSPETGGRPTVSS